MNIFDLKYKLKPFSKLFIFIGNKLKPNLSPSYKEPFSTHIPILIGVSYLIQAKYFLEIGSGFYSTSNFLNRSGFPSLIKLESFEDDKKWADLVLEKCGHDNRLTMNVVEHPMYKSVKDIDISKFDIILIDDSQSIIGRSKTIKEFCKKGLWKTINLKKLFRAFL